MSALIDPLKGFLIRTYAQLWWGTIQVASANVSGVAAAIETAVELGDVVTTAGQGVVNTVGSLGGVAVTAAQGILSTFGKLLDVAVSATKGVSGYALDLTTAAQLAIGINVPVTPEAQGIAQEDWRLLTDANSAIASLQAWSAHTWPSSPEQTTDDDVQVFLRAARVVTVASALCYAEEEKAQSLLGPDLWSTKVISQDDAQAMLYKAENQPVMILAFRGTQLPFDDDSAGAFWPRWVRDWQFVPDWIRNFDLTMKPYHANDPTGPQVHDGFLTGWQSLSDQIAYQIEKYHNEQGAPVQLFVTGHSQGAALAGVSLLDLIQQQQQYLYSIKGCLTVATPKHGDQRYTDAVRAALKNCQIPFDMLANADATSCDPVVSVPPKLSNVDPLTAPAGRLWVVRVGQKTTGPATEEEKEMLINAPLFAVIRRLVLSLPLHALGGRVGYLSAMQD